MPANSGASATKRVNGNAMVKLHLGCGRRDFGPDWIHIDGSGKGDCEDGDRRIQAGDFAHIKYHDIVNLEDVFAENSVNVIYCSHTFEYFDRDECKKVLGKWLKVLKKG